MNYELLERILRMILNRLFPTVLGMLGTVAFFCLCITRHPFSPIYVYSLAAMAAGLYFGIIHRDSYDRAR